jgi:hypothetical protein
METYQQVDEEVVNVWLCLGIAEVDFPKQRTCIGLGATMLWRVTDTALLLVVSKMKS